LHQIVGIFGFAGVLFVTGFFTTIWRRPDVLYTLTPNATKEEWEITPEELKKRIGLYDLQKSVQK
jgi:hypothetical protein